MIGMLVSGSMADQPQDQSEDNSLCPVVNFYLKIDSKTRDLIMERIFKSCKEVEYEPQLQPKKKDEKPELPLPDIDNRG